MRLPAARSASASARAPTFAGEDVELEPGGSRFEVDSVRFTLPVPGGTTSQNALAAIAACARPRRAARRHGRRRSRASRASAAASRSSARARGVEVVDDFAHNADKIAAALATAQAPTRRACSPSTSRTAMGRRASCARTSSTPSPRAPRRRPALDARSVLRRRHRVARLLRRRHRGRDCRAGRRAPSSRRRATGSWRASPPRPRPATSCWSWARAIPRSPNSRNRWSRQ